MAPMSIMVPSPISAPMLITAPIIITAPLPIETLSLIVAPGSILAEISLVSSIGIAEFLLSYSSSYSFMFWPLFSIIGFTTSYSPNTTALLSVPNTLHPVKSILSRFPFT